MAGYYQRVAPPVGAGLIVLALLLLTGWLSARRQPKNVPALIWSAVGALIVFAVNELLAKALLPARPYDVLKGTEVLVPRASGYASPTGHAAVAGAIVSGLFLARRWRLAPAALLAALLLVFSEVYVGAAYPSEVGGAAAVGLLVVPVLWPLANRFLGPAVAVIASGPLAVVVATRRPPGRPRRGGSKPMLVRRQTQRMPDSKAMDALRAASEAARKANVDQGVGEGR
jgi:membrane-associated phospholipid phosphatase